MANVFFTLISEFQKKSLNRNSSDATVCETTINECSSLTCTECCIPGLFYMVS